MRAIFAAAAACAILPIGACAQAQDEDEGALNAGNFRAFELRNIGPAFMSGRISDIEIHPDDRATWIVGVGSGGVWRTDNAGTTWTPLFDDQPVYSIGAVELDPQNPEIIWVGTGENVGGRHVAWGDGIYRSEDGGQSWENRGLPDSNHISEIIVHPNDPDTLWVAAQGPLWSSGGQRGIYKTTDGGANWTRTLGDEEWTGATDLMIDPRNPDRLYAATWQRHRTVAAYNGAGPESGVYRSEDGGQSWTRLGGGLPGGNIGKIGLAISPQDPDVVYAAIEQENREGGIWRSDDRGASWEKMSDTVSGGTGPHYYQELYASPHRFDMIILVSNYTQISYDGGRKFESINIEFKHVDDHAIAFTDDPDFMLVGSDGGLYETLDHMESWRYISNLPVTQFYKIAPDDSEPFYRVYGGTQDNSTQVGPSRTLNRHGIRNDDWRIAVFADGHQPATEHGNPDIAYGQWQQGNLVRYDATTDEIVYIQPQPAPGEPAERFNWDAPILVSRHDPARIYHASQRLWRSDDRGDSWTALSGDLTLDQDRMLLPIMGRQWSYEAGWDLYAMSVYNTLTSIAESEVDENTLWVGSDDGLIHVTRDGGANWTRIEVGDLPGAPDGAYVNDIKADLFNADTAYVAVDNHKFGDFAPYLYVTRNGGRSWRRLHQDLPEDHLVWRFVQDHVDPDLFFIGTEFGVFFSVDAGENWTELTGGSPTISYRDLVIQRRENDLVAGSFGRGIFILDDYSPLREVDEDALEEEALLFGSRRAWWYMQEHQLGFDEGGTMGHGYYRAENPPFGAVFTYYLRDGLQSLAEQRQESEAEAIEAWEDTPFPGFDRLETERREADPEIWLVIRNADGDVVRRVSGPTGSGFHRVAWDLEVPATGVVGPDSSGGAGGHMAAPGSYTVELVSWVRGESRVLAGPESFEVERLREGAIQGASPQEVVAFWERAGRLQGRLSAANAALSEAEDLMAAMRAAIQRTQGSPLALEEEWTQIRAELHEIRQALGGNQAAQGFGPQPETVASRLGFVNTGIGNSTYGPTPSHEQSLGWAEEEFETLRVRINTLVEDTLPAFEDRLDAAGAPPRRGLRGVPPL